MSASPLPLLVLSLLLIKVSLLAATVDFDEDDAAEFDDDDVGDQNPPTPEAFVTISDNFVATMGSSQSSQSQSIIK